jgi:tetratricopeptide (TPR) repeat protein
MKTLLILLFSSNVFAAGPSKPPSKEAPKPVSKAVASAEGLARVKAAMADYAKGDYQKVIDRLNPYSEELGNYGLLLLGNAYSKKLLYSDEVRVMHVLYGNNEESYEAQMLLAQALEKQSTITQNAETKVKLQKEAVTNYRNITKIRAKYKPAFDSMLALLIQMNAASEARDTIAEGIQLWGKRPELMKELCRLDSTDGYVAQALQSCREAIKLAPEFPDSYVYLSQSFFDQKENTDAEQALVGAARRFPASEFVQWSAGTVFMKKKNYPVAVRYYGQALKADPISSRSTFGYAQSLFESGKEKEALDYYRKACHMDPATVVEPFFAASAKLRLKNSPMSQTYKEAAAGCH